MTSIKTYLNSLGRMTRTILLGLAVVFVSAGIAQAATTISTNISTAGTLGVTGLSSLGSASSTQLSANTAYFGQTATSTFSSAGALTLITDLTLQNGETISNSTNAVVSIGGASDTVKILGTASTSALIVGDEPATPTINGMVFGYCSFANVSSFTATTTQYVNCTTTPTGALLATDRVFVQATSSWDTSFRIVAASSTGVSTVQLLVFNESLIAEDTTLGGTSINFWALR